MTQNRFTVIPAVYVILEQKGKTLLQRRFQTGYEDGKYGLVSGHLDGNETIRQAMVREAWEEVGIRLNPEDLIGVHAMHRRCGDHERVDFFFKAQRWEGEPIIREPHKCDGLQWVAYDDLPVNTIPYIRQAFDCIAKGTAFSEFDW